MKLLHFVSAVVVASTFAASGLASAATVEFTSDLKASSEVPPNSSTGSGTVKATLDSGSRLFKYTSEYKGLTGPVTAAHFHGPAAPGENAKPAVPVPKDALANPIHGQATLTAEQEKDLMAGKWYFNVHTAQNPGGEIRGQLERAH